MAKKSQPTSVAFDRVNLAKRHRAKMQKIKQAVKDALVASERREKRRKAFFKELRHRFVGKKVTRIFERQEIPFGTGQFVIQVSGGQRLVVSIDTRCVEDEILSVNSVSLSDFKDC